MDNIYIYRKLKSEYDNHIHGNDNFNENVVQKASWAFGVYPSTFQIYDIRECRTDNCAQSMEFYEFCVLIAAIKQEVSQSNHSFKVKPQISLPDNQKARWDVFLGGACNPTTWRLDVAIPFLKEKNITFYNPQVSKWDPSLIEIENVAKESARVLFFVLDLKRTRGIASLVEAGYLSGQGRNLVLVLPKDNPRTIDEVKMGINEIEFQSINRSFLFIAYLVQKQGIPLFSNVHDALKATRICLISKSMVQDLTEIDGVVPVKHSFVNVSKTVSTLKTVFQSFDPTQCGSLSQSNVKAAMTSMFKRQVPLISTEKQSFTFAEFCIEYSVLLLNYLHQHQEQDRSASEVNFKLRSSSLDNMQPIDHCGHLKSSVNLKQSLDIAILKKESTEKTSTTRTSILCTCMNTDNKFTSSLVRFLLCPFRRRAIKPLNEAMNVPNTEIVEMEPKELLCEKMYDVYLGGTCGNSNWRERIAIPLVEKAGCTFYNPKMYDCDWHRNLLPFEAEARDKSKVLVYIITNECTSTATLVEVAHFIGQGRKVLLYVQMLTNWIGSPPDTPMNQFLQSSCSFPLSSLNNVNQSFFSSLKTTESTTTGYQSNTSDNSQFSLPPLSGKFSTSDNSQLGYSIEANSELAFSYNNISKINLLSDDARKDHNRGRKYLLDLARREKVPIFPSIEETINRAIKWSQKPSPSHGWTSKS